MVYICKKVNNLNIKIAGQKIDLPMPIITVPKVVACGKNKKAPQALLNHKLD